MRAAKALVAAVMAILTVIATAVGDDVFVNEEITDIVTAIVAAGLSLWAVYQTRNAPPEPQPTVQPVERRTF